MGPEAKIGGRGVGCVGGWSSARGDGFYESPPISGLWNCQLPCWCWLGRTGEVSEAQLTEQEKR